MNHIGAKQHLSVWSLVVCRLLQALGMNADEAMAGTGAVPKQYPRPWTRYGIGMHGWMKRQADRFDMLRAARQQAVLEEVASGQQPVAGASTSFQRIGKSMRAPGFNPSRWTTFICGRPTVVTRMINALSVARHMYANHSRAFRLL